MAVNNPYAAYKNSKIMTASPAELTLMLYDGAIKFCNIGKEGLREKNIAKANKRVILVTAIITLSALAIYLVSIFVGGSFYDFCENAIKWVLAGIGLAFAVTFLRNMNSNNKLKFNIGVLQMKKLQIISIVLLLFAIWLSIFPIGQSSKLDELVSIISAVSGLLCGVVSLFAGDK